jgi:hypothetical protein
MGVAAQALHVQNFRPSAKKMVSAMQAKNHCLWIMTICTGWRRMSLFLFVRHQMLLLLLPAVTLSLFWTHACAAADTPLTIPVRFFQVSDDDGKRETVVHVDGLQRQLDFMNKAFEPAQVRFTFDPAHDFLPLRSTIVNDMLGTGDANWVSASREGNRIAAGCPGKLVVFVRHGPGPGQTGRSFSWFDYNFIAFAGGPRPYWSLAHETAHYFGLAHPHGGPEFKSVKEAVAYFSKHGMRPAVFDGDGLKDTPPHPAIIPLYQGRDRLITLDGHPFTILRGNVVSYYHYPKPEGDLAAGTMTPEQLVRLRWFLLMRLKHGMAMPTNSLIAHPIEAASLRVLRTHKCHVSPQPMDGFFKDHWSGKRQLFGRGDMGGQVTLALPVPRSGRQQLVVALTHAPDYGRLRFWLDGHPLPTAFDGYAPSVIPSGPIRLGIFDLGAGLHRFTVKIVGKDPQASGFAFGLDCLQLGGRR